MLSRCTGTPKCIGFLGMMNMVFWEWWGWAFYYPFNPNQSTQYIIISGERITKYFGNHRRILVIKDAFTTNGSSISFCNVTGVTFKSVPKLKYFYSAIPKSSPHHHKLPFCLLWFLLSAIIACWRTVCSTSMHRAHANLLQFAWMFTLKWRASCLGCFK